jgi:hypothetical protein
MRIKDNSIYLDADEVAVAIDAYLTAHRVNIDGPRTISQKGGLVTAAHIYVDPSGRIIDNREFVQEP